MIINNVTNKQIFQYSIKFERNYAYLPLMTSPYPSLRLLRDLYMYICNATFLVSIDMEVNNIKHNYYLLCITNVNFWYMHRTKWQQFWIFDIIRHVFLKLKLQPQPIIIANTVQKTLFSFSDLQ